LPDFSRIFLEIGFYTVVIFFFLGVFFLKIDDVYLICDKVNNSICVNWIKTEYLLLNCNYA
jgi:hypothetical protein